MPKAEILPTCLAESRRACPPLEEHLGICSTCLNRQLIWKSGVDLQLGFSKILHLAAIQPMHPSPKQCKAQ